jgi:cell division ATPase FtsA
MLDGLDRQPDSIELALGGEATLRVIDMPFQDARKIDQVIGYELESQILGELDGLVVDQVLAEPHGDGARVLAIGIDRTVLSETIAALAAVRAEPRHIGAAVLSYGALSERAMPAARPPVMTAGEDQVDAEVDDEPARTIETIIDIGHRTTRVAFVENGRTLFARSITRAGADLTSALAETYRLDENAAQRAKHAQATLLTDPHAAVDPQRRKLDQVLRDALRPLVRELKQTFAAARSQGLPGPTRAGLLGGTSRLPGLAVYLEQELAIPVVRMSLPAELTPLPPGGETEGPGLPGVALGMTLASAQASGTQVNLRKGELSFRNDYSYLRGKTRWLGVAAFLVLLFIALNSFAALRALRKESDVLQAKLKRETTELFGAPKLEGKAVSDELRRGPQSGMPPVPATTAYDLLDDISRHLPARDAVKLDIIDLDIKPKKTSIKATAASAKEIDTIVESLKQVDCFGEIQKGKTSSVNEMGGADGKEKIELKQFTLTIETTCP